MVASVSPRSALGVRLPRAGGTVLVVEDDQALVEVLVMLVEQAGYATAVARDGDAAVRLAKWLRPDLITLDLELPGIPGQAVLDALNADRATREIPVVVFSANVDDLRPTRQVRLVLVKPWGVDWFVEAIQPSPGP